MIEKILHAIIEDLGVTGVLIVGFFCVQYYATKKICAFLRYYNHQSDRIIELLEKMIDLWEYKPGGKI